MTQPTELKAIDPTLYEKSHSKLYEKDCTFGKFEIEKSNEDWIARIVTEENVLSVLFPTTPMTSYDDDSEDEDYLDGFIGIASVRFLKPIIDYVEIFTNPDNYDVYNLFYIYDLETVEIDGLDITEIPIYFLGYLEDDEDYDLNYEEISRHLYQKDGVTYLDQVFLEDNEWNTWCDDDFYFFIPPDRDLRRLVLVRTLQLSNNHVIIATRNISFKFIEDRGDDIDEQDWTFHDSIHISETITHH